MDRLQAVGQIRGVDRERRRVTTLISTGNIARDEAIIDQSGWDFSNYDRNPVVLFGHDDTAMPVARTVERYVTADGLVGTAEFDEADAVAMRLFGKIERGYMNAASVRWLPKRTETKTLTGEDGRARSVLIFREQELLEWSFVTIPADPSALIMRADGSPLDVRTLTIANDNPANQGAGVETPSAREARLLREIRADKELEKGGRGWYALDELYGLNPQAYHDAIRGRVKAIR